MTGKKLRIECLYETKKIEFGVTQLVSDPENDPLDELIHITYAMKGTLGVEGYNEAQSLAELLQQFFSALQDEDEIPPLPDVIHQDTITVVEALKHQFIETEDETYPDNAVKTLQICIDESVAEAESLRLPDDAPMPPAQRSEANSDSNESVSSQNTTKDTSRGAGSGGGESERQFTPAGGHLDASPEIKDRVAELFGQRRNPGRTRATSFQAPPFNRETITVPNRTPETTTITVQLVNVNGNQYAIPMGDISSIPERGSDSPPVEKSLRLREVLDEPPQPESNESVSTVPIQVRNGTGELIVYVDAIGEVAELTVTPLTGAIHGIAGVRGVGDRGDGETIHVLDVARLRS